MLRSVTLKTGSARCCVSVLLWVGKSSSLRYPGDESISYIFNMSMESTILHDKVHPCVCYSVVLKKKELESESGIVYVWVMSF